MPLALCAPVSDVDGVVYTRTHKCIYIHVHKAPCLTRYKFAILSLVAFDQLPF